MGLPRMVKTMSLSKLITRLVTKSFDLAICMVIGATSVYAQSGIMSPGDAAVTGFSGIANPATDTILFDNKGPRFV
jgi:hypothetical protein